MTRVCFQLRVRPDRLEEYTARHTPVSPDMLREIAASGRRNYSLFLLPDGLLIGYYETDDQQAADDYLAASTIAIAWEREMAPFFEGLDGRADQGATVLPEVFNLESQLAASATTIARPESRKQDIS
jgi:L-rhamnose mutarotase